MTGATLTPPHTNGVSKNNQVTADDGGYNANVFAGKEEQMVQVGEYLEKSGFLPASLVQNEVSWFYG